MLKLAAASFFYFVVLNFGHFILIINIPQHS